MAEKFDLEIDERWLAVSFSETSVMSRKQAKLFGLVLDSRSIPFRIHNSESAVNLSVPEDHYDTAIRELNLFQEANKNWPSKPYQQRPLLQNKLSTISLLILIATFHNLTIVEISFPDFGIIDWRGIGSANAEKIIAGEWWRSVTSLTLHADFSHLISNLAIGAIFITILAGELGSGLAWLLLIFSGSFGNILNAYLHLHLHNSVGASTAIFASVGILAASSIPHYRHQLKKRWFVPVAAGAALLAILGTEGKSTDLGAHLFGFCFGILFGLVTEFFLDKYGRPNQVLNFLLAFLSAVLVLTSWMAAIYFNK